VEGDLVADAGGADRVGGVDGDVILATRDGETDALAGDRDRVGDAADRQLAVVTAIVLLSLLRLTDSFPREPHSPFHHWRHVRGEARSDDGQVAQRER
jgi:hypothetical protein